MSEQNKELSKLCLAGFILSIMPVAVLALCALIDNITPPVYRVNLTEDLVPGAFIFLPLGGFIVSIAGLVTARRDGKKGKGFGIAGAVLPSATLILIAVMIGTVLFGSGSIRKNEMYGMGGIEGNINTEYDVSQIRLPEGYNLNSLNITVSETELKTYAESRLQTITSESKKSIKGKYQDYNFLIVRSDRLDDWLSANRPRGFEYHDGYASVSYDEYWEIAATRPVPLAVYKDPSDKFIVITNCSDNRVISEFFGLTDNYIDPALTTETSVRNVEETTDPVILKNNEQVDYLKDNINKDMPLSEIIDIFEETCDQSTDKDAIMFKHGVGYFRDYDYSFSDTDDSTKTHYNDEQFYCFGLAREFLAENGKTYQICVEVLYGINSQNRNLKLTLLTNDDVDGDFFDYIRNSDAYKYASAAKIKKIRIYSMAVV